MRYLLIHGGYHGAWCWEKLVPQLELSGHTATAIDLPGAGDRRHEKATHNSWRGALREVIEEGDVLVGHSMGGYAITLAADEVPDKVARLVYLAAAVPADGETIGLIGEHWPATVGMPFDQFMEVVELPNLGPCRRFTNQVAANKIFYADCTSEDQQWAWDHLTAQQLSISEDRFHLPRFRTAPIPKDYIVTTQDEALPPEFMSGLMQRLGLTTAFCIVASHSPFVSLPEETAILLNACALGLLG